MGGSNPQALHPCARQGLYGLVGPRLGGRTGCPLGADNSAHITHTHPVRSLPWSTRGRSVVIVSLPRRLWGFNTAGRVDQYGHGPYLWSSDGAGTLGGLNPAPRTPPSSGNARQGGDGPEHRPGATSPTSPPILLPTVGDHEIPSLEGLCDTTRPLDEATWCRTTWRGLLNVRDTRPRRSLFSLVSSRPGRSRRRPSGLSWRQLSDTGRSTLICRRVPTSSGTPIRRRFRLICRRRASRTCRSRRCRRPGSCRARTTRSCPS